MTITENDQLSDSNKVLEFSQQTLNSLFKFADNLLSALSIVDSSLRTAMRTIIQQGMEYVTRGSMMQAAPGADATIISGTNYFIISGRISAKGYSGSATISSPSNTQVSITIPQTAMTNSTYLQVTVVNTAEMAYSITPGHSDGVIKSGMIRVNIEESDSSLATVGDRAYSKRLAISNLADPILIKIPYSGSIGAINTLSCGYTATEGDTVRFTGIQTQINDDNTVTCSTNHLTDFVVEEHVDPIKAIVDPTITVDTAVPLNAYKSFAFWMTLLLLLALPVFIVLVIKKDAKDKKKYTSEELKNSKVHVYNCVWFNLKTNTSKPEDEKAQDDFDRPQTAKTDIKTTSNAFNNTHVYTSNATMVKSKGLKIVGDDRVSSRPAEQSVISDDSEGDEKFKRTVGSFQPPLDDDEGDVTNIFLEKPAETKVIDNKSDLPEEEEVSLNLNRRKRKKRKIRKKKKEDFIKENENAADDITASVVTMQYSNNQGFEEEKKLNFNIEPDNDYEGGEGEDDQEPDDKIKPYDIHQHDNEDPLADTMYPALNLDDTLKPKKRKGKRKLLKKKKKKAMLEDTLTPIVGDKRGKFDIILILLQSLII